MALILLNTVLLGTIYHDQGQYEQNYREAFRAECGGDGASIYKVLWGDGGCENWHLMPSGKKPYLADKSYTVESCNEACAARPWCTHFLLGQGADAGHCIPLAAGCERGTSPNWIYYQRAPLQGTDAALWLERELLRSSNGTSTRCAAFINGSSSAFHRVHGVPFWLYDTQHYLSIVFTLIFAVELVLKLSVLGTQFFRKLSNTLDFVLVPASTHVHAHRHRLRHFVIQHPSSIVLQ